MSENLENEPEGWTVKEKGTLLTQIKQLQEENNTMKVYIVSLRKDLNDLVFLLYGHQTEVTPDIAATNEVIQNE
jgi:hypothetical protein